MLGGEHFLKTVFVGTENESFFDPFWKKLILALYITTVRNASRSIRKSQIHVNKG